jgi:hypothetical protein
MESQINDENKPSNDDNIEKKNEIDTIKIESVLDDKIKEQNQNVSKKSSLTLNTKDDSSFDEDLDLDSDKSSDFNENNNSDKTSEDNNGNIKKKLTMDQKNKNSAKYKIEKYNREKRKSDIIEAKLISSIMRKENPNKKNLKLANKINFRTVPDKIIETDEFGFLKKVERIGEEP